ncbi:MAG: CPBP family glutamic-type intramembrane protease [Polyangiaceae bacterium]
MVWFVSFAVLARLGTWTTFAFVGGAMAALLIGLRAVPIGLLKPTRANVGLGLTAGLAMVLLTHVAYYALNLLAPVIGAATARLMGLLNVSGFSAGARTGLIVLIASCEEILFRGAIPKPSTSRAVPLREFKRRDLRRVVSLAAVYALTTTPLGSPLLAICAVLCGSLWGVLALTTGSLVTPMLAHVVWDLGVLIVWPLLR